MISVDKLTLKRLRAGESVTIRHRTKRMMRHGQSYALTVDGKPNAARVLVATAEIKKGSKYVWLLGCVIDREEQPRFLAARPAGGEMMDVDSGHTVRDYVRNPHMAMAGEPEAVDAFSQRRITRDAKARERTEQEALILAALDVQGAIRERLGSPEFRRLAGLSYHRLNKEIEHLIVKTKKRAA